MSVHDESNAVQVARSNVTAWTNHDLAATRATVADNAMVVVTTTQAETPAVSQSVNTTGIEDYVLGLENFVKAVIPGSLKEIAAVGDERNALLMFTVQADFGAGRFTLPNARLYRLNDDNKIMAEQVVFFAGS